MDVHQINRIAACTGVPPFFAFRAPRPARVGAIPRGSGAVPPFFAFRAPGRRGAIPRGAGWPTLPAPLVLGRFSSGRPVTGPCRRGWGRSQGLGLAVANYLRRSGRLHVHTQLRIVYVRPRPDIATPIPPCWAYPRAQSWPHFDIATPVTPPVCT